MTDSSTLDPKSFQKILACAFVVQQSLIDAQLPSAMLTLRHLIAVGELHVNGAMHLIAGRARTVANASGVAIGLLRGDQLVYRAGSGSAATYVGRHLTATLSVSAKIQPKGEILRVEDAATEAGIGGAICRQFGANALLILPIYHEQVLIGILQVFFNQVHGFQDGEVCAYLSMASVVREVMTLTKVEPKKPVALELATMPAIEQRTSPVQRFPKNSKFPASSVAIRQAGGAIIAESEKLTCSMARPAGAMNTYRAKRVPWHIRMWKAADRAAVIILVVTASWIAYTDRTLAPEGVVVRQKSDTVKHQVPFVPTQAGSAKTDTRTPQTASVPTKNLGKTARSMPPGVRVSDYKTDSISEEVTVRHFPRKPAPQQVPLGDQVEYVSEDVTIRHFAPKLAVVSPRQPADRAAAVTPR